MKHPNMNDLLSAYANGELNRTQREYTEEHLAGCVDCRATLTDYAWVRDRLSSLRTTLQETNIKAATMHKIDALGTASMPVRTLIRPALAALAVAVALIATFLLQLPGVSPSVRIAEAHATTAGLQYYRMTGSTVSTSNGQTSRAIFEWEFAAPDRYRGKLSVDGDKREFIIIGEEQYTRESGSGESTGSVVVITGGGYSVFNPIPSKEGTLQILDSLTDLEGLPDKQLDGEDARRFRGKVDMDRIVDEQIEGLDPESPQYDQTVELSSLQRSATIDVALWIGKEDSTLRQLKLDVQFPTLSSGPRGMEQSGVATFSTLVRFLDLNKPIDINPPVTPSGDPEPGWMQVTGGPPSPIVEKSGTE